MVSIVRLCQEVSNVVFQRVPSLAEAANLLSDAGSSAGQGECGLRGAVCLTRCVLSLNVGPVWSGACLHSCSPGPTHPHAVQPFRNRKPRSFSLQRQVVEIVPFPLSPLLGFLNHSTNGQQTERVTTPPHWDQWTLVALLPEGHNGVIKGRCTGLRLLGFRS